jgi:hypothetical protein
MKLLIAGIAFELRLPVSFIIHVLDGSLLATKLAIARFAFIVIVHGEFVLSGLVR